MHSDLRNIPERRAALRPGSFDRRAVDRAVRDIHEHDGPCPDAWRAVLDTMADTFEQERMKS